jgi:hypothetical protein
MKKKQKKVIYCRLGLSNVYDDRIELNKELKYNKKLRDYIIKHELGHDINSFDLIHEFRINYKIVIPLIWFVLTNPLTWIDFLPIQRRNKHWIIDSNMLILYLILIAHIGLFIFILKMLR